ncbi:MAG: molybdopterin-containing oxidoreductase family protein [Thermodesulfobacteriota bacterium]
MKDRSTVRSTCGQCYAGCGIIVHLGKDGPCKIEGDPESPVNRGALCEKAPASLEYLSHPERLRHPLRRVGERGGGCWQRISWDEALDAVAEGLGKAGADFGPEGVAFIQGAAKGLQDTYLCRLANVFGSPNFVSQGYVCFLPRKFGSLLTFGFAPNPDYDFPPRCILVWGSHKAKIREYQDTLRAREKGAKLVVIDPRGTELAGKAHRWLRVRPGADLALALAMIHVIIHEERYDRDFVKQWTLGFDRLREHVKDYPPERAADTAWVAAEAIREAARLYASERPGFIQMGNAFEHNLNSFQTVRALSILKGLTGNLGVPGGEVYRVPLPIPDRYDPALTLADRLPKEKEDLRLGSENRFLPLYRHAQAPAVVRAMLEGRPYPVRAAFVQGSNPLLTYPNARETRRAFVGLDFLAVSEFFMTPTAALADVVLPSATYLEFESIVYPPYYPVAQAQNKVAEVEGCRSDLAILSGLARRLGLGRFFWERERDFLDRILKPLNMDFERFSEAGPLAGEKAFGHFRFGGFATPSGKVEFFSERLEQWGFDPLPVYREPPETPFNSSERAREYPLVLTSWKSEYYRHSGGRQIESLRRGHPEPVVRIHPETAAALGLREGDWVRVSTKRGSIRQKAALSDDLDPRVVGVDYAWWFPERGAEGRYGWDESNINVLTDLRPPYGRELGSACLRGFSCRIEKEEHRSAPPPGTSRGGERPA